MTLKTDPSSASSSPSWEHISCPDCRGPLRFDPDTWNCTTCKASYPITGGVPDLIGKNSQLNDSEVATQDEVSELYRDVRYKNDASRLYHEYTLEQLIDLVAPRGDVLDDGCGPGLFMEFLRERGPAMKRYVGIDVSAGMLAEAHKHRSTDDPELLLRADACLLPFDSESFDVVYVRGLLHHLPDPAAGLHEVARVLKPGGSALVLEPNKTVISALPRFVARKGKHFDDDHKNFSANTIRKLVASALEIDQVEFYGYLAYPILGYPDIANFGRLLPIDTLAPTLIKLDEAFAATPGLRRFGWGVILRATKA